MLQKSRYKTQILGYYAEKFPYKPPQWKIRSTSHAGLSGRLCGNISIYSIVRLPEAGISTQQPAVETVRLQASHWQNMVSK
jgi:hypothetical protein